MATKNTKKTTAGRPPKFEEASSPVTVTLPLRILTALQQVDADRAKAIVKCTEALVDSALANRKQVEIIKVLEGAGLIIIAPCPSLHKLPGLRLIEIAPLRFLLVIMKGYTPHALELDIMDLIESLAPEENEERGLLNELRRELSLHRRQESIESGEILFVDI